MLAEEVMAGFAGALKGIEDIWGVQLLNVTDGGRWLEVYFEGDFYDVKKVSEDD